MSFTIIIPTLNRPKILRQTLESILQQSLLPKEIILVDQSDSDETKKEFETWNTNVIQKKYIQQKEKSLIKARNNGIKNCVGSEYILFLDDDVLVAADSFKTLVSFLNNDSQNKYAAACGNVSNFVRTNDFFKKLFLMPHFGNGKFLSNGCPTFFYGLNTDMDVEFSPGGFTLWKASVVKKYLYDESLPGYGYGDDTDITYRVSRNYKVRYIPAASVTDLATPTGRDPGSKHRRMWLQNMYYLLEKNIGINFTSLFSFWWMWLGHVLHDLIKLKRSSLIGNLSGALCIITGRNND